MSPITIDELRQLVLDFGLEVYFFWGKIEHDKWCFHIREPIKTKISFDGEGFWGCDCKEFEIFSYGKSLKEALESFVVDFVDTWEKIAQERDENLIKSAIKLKRKMKERVVLK